MPLLEYLSDFGDTLVAGTAALIIFAWLWARLGLAVSLMFLICFAGALGSVVGLKFIAYSLCPPLDQASLFAPSQGAPSGHVAFATIVYGSLAAILVVVDRRPVAWLAAAICAAVIATVAVTRVVLIMHTAGDVVAGFAVGAIGVVVFARVLREQVQSRQLGALSLFAIVGVAAALLLVSGSRFETMAGL
jgi:membrane-associated phospholipid phosphatase